MLLAIVKFVLKIVEVEAFLNEDGLHIVIYLGTVKVVDWRVPDTSKYKKSTLSRKGVL